MAEFRYALFGDPIDRSVLRKKGEVAWRLSVQTDRVKWLFKPGPFVLDTPALLRRGELVLRRDPPTNNPRLIQRVRFVICPTQREAVDRLLGTQQPNVHFVPSITDPILQDEVTNRLPARPRNSRPISKWNINYLGFRVDRVPEPTRRAIAARVVPVGIRAAAGIPEDWGVHDMAPLDFSNTGGRTRAPHTLTKLTFIYNSANELDLRVGREIVGRLALAQNQVRTCTSYATLVDRVKNDPDVGMFLYNWYIQKPRGRAKRNATPVSWRLLHPLFHSRCIGHTNLSHYDDGDDDSAIEAVLSNPQSATSTLTTIMGKTPMIVLYHAVRFAAWGPNVVGLRLRDPDCQPIDRLATVQVI